MASTLTRAEVLRVAALARLELTDADVDLFTGQLAEILGFAAEIRRIDTTGVPPTSHAVAATPVWREDRPIASLDRRAVLEAAPGAAPAAGLFKVPKVL
jgi:aspartyl-tRNA(Asn)/glutamyl-tRNA(Gln) amidotransferase subunit C